MTGHRTDGSARRASALPETQLLSWLMAGSLLVGALALSPLAYRADHLSAWFHYGQHVAIVMVAIALGGGARQLVRARPLAPWRVGVVGFAAALAAIAGLHSWVRDEGGVLHSAQHALVVTAALLAGVVIRELLVARSGGAAVLAPHAPVADSLRDAWRAVAGSRLPLAGVLGIALYVRISSLGFQSLTDDEGYSFALAQRSFGHMLALFRWEGNGTLYSVVLWPLVRVSDSADMLRLPAALAGVAAVAAVYWAGRELATRQVALLAAFLLAVSPMALRYSQFARPFSFVLLLSALSFALLARHLRIGSTAALARYALVLGLAAYTNSLAPVLLVPVHALLVAPAGRAAVRRWALAVGGAVVVAGPVIALAVVESGRRDPLYWLASPSAGQIARVAQEFMIGRAPSALGLVRAASVIGVVAAAVLLAAAARRRDRPWRLFALTFVPPAVALAISLGRPVFFGAYLIVMLPGLCLLLASGATRLPRRAAVAAVGVLTLAWLTADVAMMRPPLVNDYRAAAAWIATQRSAGDPLIIDPITRLPGYAYYEASLRAPDGDIVVKEWRERAMPPGVTGFTDPGGYGDAPAGPPSVADVSRLARRTGRLVLVVDTPSGQGDVETGVAARWMHSHCNVREGSFDGIAVLAARRCLP